MILLDKFDFEVIELVDDANFWTVLILIGISQSPSSDVLRLPSRTFLLSLYACNFFFARITLQLSSKS